ncbi:MAG TPA: cysteine--tRNA ligase [Actinomycetota bacterium]|nr:cysteine--tRNA ligase [Actinomycetota bacterium]
MIKVHDTLAKKVVPLDTRDPGRVAAYLCGPTVYNYVHIGNARTVAWFEFVRRYLVYRGYDVTYVMNYTDVDDKIIERARVEGLSVDEVTQKYEAAFEDDMAALGVAPPDVLCRATDHVGDMIGAIEGLVARGAAYDTGGDVFFAIERFPGYGKLSGRSLDDMRAGERVDPHPGKRHPLDFALWKSAKPGEPSWESPWGRGRPGWHIECSVMSTKYLGMGFDLHGGASDLVFPHHENEIAQAEALAGDEPFVRHWIHAGLVQMDAEKMSKSLGNVVLARDAVRAFGGEVVRYWILMGSYRSQPAFSEAALDDARHGYERWRTFLDNARHALGDDMPAPRAPRRPVDDDVVDGPGAHWVRAFVDALDDDLNSPGAFAAVHGLVRAANGLLARAQAGDAPARAELRALTETFLELTGVLGFSFPAPAASNALIDGLVEYLLELRQQARAERAFERADAIRARLDELGVTIEDTPAGARWRLRGERPR